MEGYFINHIRLIHFPDPLQCRKNEGKTFVQLLSIYHFQLLKIFTVCNVSHLEITIYSPGQVPGLYIFLFHHLILSPEAIKDVTLISSIQWILSYIIIGYLEIWYKPCIIIRSNWNHKTCSSSLLYFIKCLCSFQVKPGASFKV